jgi:hypothetical protein
VRFAICRYAGREAEPNDKEYAYCRGRRIDGMVEGLYTLNLYGGRCATFGTAGRVKLYSGRCPTLAAAAALNLGARAQGEPTPQAAHRRQWSACRAMSRSLGHRNGSHKQQSPREEGFIVCRISDDDLLSRGIPRTIIGAASFHGPVRYGKAWGQRAMVVREDGGEAGWACPTACFAQQRWKK